MKHGLEYEKNRKHAMWLERAIFIYSTKTKHFYQMFLVLFPYGTRCKMISKRLNFVTKNIESFIWEREKGSNQTIALYEFVNLSSVVGIEKVPMFQFCEFGLNP